MGEETVKLPSTKFLRSALLGGCFGVLSSIGAQAQGNSPSTAIEYRQNVMQGLEAHRDAIIAIVDDEVEYRSHILAHATALHRLSVMAADVFPQGSGGDDTRAMGEIWEDEEGFREARERLESAASGLLDAVYAGDIGAVEESVTDVQRACTGCHRTFRKPDELPVLDPLSAAVASGLPIRSHLAIRKAIEAARDP